MRSSTREAISTALVPGCFEIATVTAGYSPRASMSLAGAVGPVPKRT